MVYHFFLQWTTFCQTFPPRPVRLGWPHRTWLSFIELDKAVVRVIRFASFLWLWFQCVCPLMPSRNTYCLTWVSLTLDLGILLQQSAATAPYLGGGRPSWPRMGSSSFQPYCSCAATTPWTWGCSSPEARWHVITCQIECRSKIWKSDPSIKPAVKEICRNKNQGNSSLNHCLGEIFYL